MAYKEGHNIQCHIGCKSYERQSAPDGSGLTCRGRIPAGTSPKLYSPSTDWLGHETRYTARPTTLV